ncbi:AmmeMemoRadiSam system protein B [Thermopirellula anaerolimosa]
MDFETQTGRTENGNDKVVPNPPQLSASQREAVLRAAARWVADFVNGRPASEAPTLPDDVASLPVWGIFVSLKRQSKLRACCGRLGEGIPLAKALSSAAELAAKHDLRFPPIQPAELQSLTIEVWLLWGLETIREKGEDRAGAVEIGRHGLMISRGGSSGLLLPGVATEHGFDARTFLEQVCVKAGLPRNAWLEDNVDLKRFEGYSLSANLGEFLTDDSEASATAAASGPGRGDVDRLAALARNNLGALAFGAVPTWYAPNLYDGQVQGVVLTIKTADQGERVLEAGRVLPAAEMPLQATLADLVQSALSGLQSVRQDPQSLAALRVGLTVLRNPRMLGAGSACDLKDFDPRTQALAAVWQDRWAVVYDPQVAKEEVLRRVLARLRCAAVEDAEVWRLDCLSTEPHVELGNARLPLAGASVRRPAVAGRFYPADPEELYTMLDTMLPRERSNEHWAGALVPHAGWIYSGKLAARVLARIKIPPKVLIFGPKHVPHGSDWAVAPHRTWALPGLSMHSDPDLARRIAECVPPFEADAVAHAAEHCIEVQLPILARLAPASQVVGLVMREGDYDMLCRAADALAKLLQSLPELPLLVVSTDMHHYSDDAATRKLDAEALEAVRNLDARQLWDTVRRRGIKMCGYRPTVLVMETLRRLGKLNHCEQVGYATSADASGDTREVVGYAGLLWN